MAIRVFLGVLVLAGLALKTLPWYVALGGGVAILLVAQLGGGKLLALVLLQLIKAKGRVLRGARVEVHAVEPAPDVALRAGFIDAFRIDLTIAPKAAAGPFKLWDPGELSFARPGVKPEDAGNDRAAPEIEVRETIYGAEARPFDGEKVPGALRLRFTVARQTPDCEVVLLYFLEALGPVALPAPRPVPKPAPPPTVNEPRAAEAIFDVYGREPEHFTAPPVPGIDVQALQPVSRSESPERFGRAALPPAGVPDPAPDVLDKVLHATVVHRVRVSAPDARDLRHIASAMTVAASLAREVDGVVRDVATGRLLSFDDVRAIVKAPEFRIRDHVLVHGVHAGEAGLTLHTHGLSKFGRPDIEVRRVPEPYRALATEALLAAADYASRGRPLQPGQTVRLGASMLRCVPAESEGAEDFRCGLVGLADMDAEPSRPEIGRWLAAVAITAP